MNFSFFLLLSLSAIIIAGQAKEGTNRTVESSEGKTAPEPSGGQNESTGKPESTTVNAKPVTETTASETGGSSAKGGQENGKSSGKGSETNTGGVASSGKDERATSSGIGSSFKQGDKTASVPSTLKSEATQSDELPSTIRDTISSSGIISTPLAGEVSESNVASSTGNDGVQTSSVAPSSSGPDSSTSGTVLSISTGESSKGVSDNGTTAVTEPVTSDSSEATNATSTGPQTPAPSKGNTRTPIVALLGTCITVCLCKMALL